MADLLMVDSAWPIPDPPAADITLIYAGGNTPHPWSPAEIAAIRTRWAWPTWVRSNPSAVSITADVNACLAWLRTHQVPKGTAVVLDLETAVAPSWVAAFSQVLTLGGYPVTKYGSQGFIWRNPRTSGGTFVAAPGVTRPVTTGDCVATQFKFAGAYDLSWVQPTVPLWDLKGDTMTTPLTDQEIQKIAAACEAAVWSHVIGKFADGTDRHAVGALNRLDADRPGVNSALAGLAKNLGRQQDPAVVAAAVISGLAAGGFTPDEIASHIAAGLPPDLAEETARALLALVAQIPPAPVPPATP